MSMSLMSVTEALEQMPLDNVASKANGVQELFNHQNDTDEKFDDNFNSIEEKSTSLYSLNLREYATLSHITDLIPLQAQRGIKTFDIKFLSLDVTADFVAIGSNIGTLYLYERYTGELHRLRYEDYIGDITAIKIYPGLDSLVAFGTADGQILVFLIPTKGSHSKSHRYDIINVHTKPIKALEWNTNGYQLFSGDLSGLVAETNFDFFEKSCNSRTILKETWAIIQLSYQDRMLAVSTLQRALLCNITEQGNVLLQVGLRERKSYGRFGVVFTSNSLFTSRPGLRLWVADTGGTVKETILLKKSLEGIYCESIQLQKLKNANSEVANTKPMLKIEVSESKPTLQFEKLQVFQEIFLLSWNRDSIFIIDPVTRTIIGCCKDLGDNLLDVAINQNEVFFLQEPRNLRRVGSEPEDILYPQIKIPRETKDEFSFFNNIKNPFQEFLKKTQMNNNELSKETNKEDNPRKVLTWLKSFASPDKSDVAKEMQAIYVPPLVKTDLSKPLLVNSDWKKCTDAKNESDPLAIVFQPKKKKKPKRKRSKDIIDSSSMERSSDGLQWDNYQSNSPETINDFPAELLYTATPNENAVSENSSPISVELTEIEVHAAVETEDERLAKILNLYTSVAQSQDVVPAVDNTKLDNKIEVKCDSNLNLTEVDHSNTSETNLENSPQIESPTPDIYSRSAPNWDNNIGDVSRELNLPEEKISFERMKHLQEPKNSTNVLIENLTKDNDNEITLFKSNDFNYSLDEWLQHKAPSNNPVINIAISKNHVYIVDSKENIFWSPINCNFLKWKSMDSAASQISISQSSKVIWLMHQGFLYSSTVQDDGKIKLPMLISAKNVSSISLDHQTGWFISNGKLFAQLNLTDKKPCDKQHHLVPKHPLYPKQISCCNDVLWVSTHDGHLYALGGISETNPLGLEFRKINLPSLAREISGLSLASNETAWLIIDDNRFFFKTNVTHCCPTGSGWYEIEANQYSLNEQNQKKPRPVEITKDKLKNILAGHQKPTIASSGKGVFLFNGYFLMASRDDIIGHEWKPFRQDGTSTSLSFKWSLISANTVKSQQDPIWAVYLTGELFCFNEVDSQPIAVNSPTQDGSTIKCLSPCDNVMWVLTDNNNIYIRHEISPTAPEGTYWTKLEDQQLDDIKLTHISCATNIVWACDKNGFVFVRVGPLEPCLKTMASVWISIDEIDDVTLSMIMVHVGSNPLMVWALNSNGIVYVRKGVTTNLPIGENWEMVPGIQAKCIAITKSAVCALTINGDVFYRYGIDIYNPSGDVWIKLPGSFSFLSASPSNKLWALDNEGNLFHHATATIKFDTNRSIHAKQNYLPYSPDMGEEWEVVN